MKQTAVEWFGEKVLDVITTDEFNNLLEQATEMEKEQIVNAWENGKKSTKCKSPICQRKTGNGYFNKTFKNEE